MHNSTFRMRVSESMASLPVVAIFVALFWILPNPASLPLWGGLAVLAFMTYVIVEWNNQFQLLRVRSRMNSVTFLTLMAAFPMLHEFSWHVVAAACLLLAYFCLFRAYDAYQPQGYVFHAFFFLSIGSLIYPPLLLLVPFLLWSTHRQLRALTGKSLAATCFGLLLPYWLAVPALFYFRSVGTQVWQHWQSYLMWTPPHWTSMPPAHLVSALLLLLLSLICISHFVRTSFNDKIRTRQYFYLLLTQEIPFVALLVAFPHHFPQLLPFLLLQLTPFAAHYFALARGRGMNAWFIVWVILVVALGTINYLNLWTLFSNFLSTTALPECSWLHSLLVV